MDKYLLTAFLGICFCLLQANKPYQNKPSADINGKETAADILPKTSQIKNIRKYGDILKKFFVSAEPAQEADAWQVPFAVGNRSDIKEVKFVAEYGDFRSSRMAGHRHSGVDIVPAGKSAPLDVYPAAKGVVCFVTQEAPVKTVIIKHRLKDGSTLYTAYIHLKDIFIENGQNVDENTKIGVLYNKKEALKYGGNFDHLHFEVKKRIDDYSCASWLCMSRAELDEYFINPRAFFNTHLK